MSKSRKQWEAGELGNHNFKKIDDRAVDEAIAMQEQCGLDVITDA